MKLDIGEKFFAVVGVVMVVALAYHMYDEAGKPPAPPSEAERAREMQAVNDRLRAKAELNVSNNEGVAKATILTMLKDPDSARFRDIKSSGDVLCGMVNARNGFGGYTGFVPFSYDPTTRMAALQDKADPACR